MGHCTMYIWRLENRIGEILFECDNERTAVEALPFVVGGRGNNVTEVSLVHYRLEEVSSRRIV